MHHCCFKTLFIDKIFHLYGDWVLHFHLNTGGAGGMGLEGHNSGESAPAEDLGGFSRKERVVASKAGRDGDRSHREVRRIKHWVKLDDESARLLGELVAIERAWGRQVNDEEVLAAMIRVGHRMRRIEAHIPARSSRPHA
jgi:hypothetical protein